MSIIQLELTNAVATLANLNTRTDKNGDADVPAADLNIELFTGREVLAFFSPPSNPQLGNTMRILTTCGNSMSGAFGSR